MIQQFQPALCKVGVFAERLPINVRKVWQYILENGLAPGDRIPTEPELAGALKISRFRLREALSFLERYEVVERRPKVGTIIKQLSLTPIIPFLRTFTADYMGLMEATLDATSDVDFVREARAALESIAAFQATVVRRVEDLAALGRSIEEMLTIRARVDGRVAADEADLREWLDADRAFHLAILTATHNPYLSTLGSILIEMFTSMQIPLDICEEGVAGRIILEHRQIAEWISRGVQRDELRNDKQSSEEQVIRNALRAQFVMYKHIISPKGDNWLPSRPWFMEL